MDVIEKYGKLIKKSNPKRALNLIKTGLKLKIFQLKKFPDKNLPKSLQYLQKIGTEFILEPFNIGFLQTGLFSVETCFSNQNIKIGCNRGCVKL